MKPVIPSLKPLLFLLLATCCSHAASLTPAQLEFVEKKVRPVFDARCYDCHDADTKKGSLDLTALKPDISNPDTLALWLRIYDRVAAGEMPPKKKQPLAEAERQAIVAGIGGMVTVAERTHAAESGRSALRRMNRVEYENTLRDLLALPLLRVKNLLPEDGQKFGFDKVGGALDISHIQMSKYMQAADVALHKAVVKIAKAPEKVVFRSPAAKQGSAGSAIAINTAAPLIGRNLAPGLTTSIAGNPVANIGNSYLAASFKGDADSVAMLSGVVGAHQPEGLQFDKFKPTVSGWYRVRFSIWSLRWEGTQAVAAVRGMVRHKHRLGPPYFKDENNRWQATLLPPR